MHPEAGLVGSLVERLTTRLPHRTGIQGPDLSHDEVAIITRATLTRASIVHIDIVLEALVSLLEDLVRPYTNSVPHPSHVVLSEHYILALLAECCSAHWKALRQNPHNANGNGVENGGGAKPAWNRIVPRPLNENLISRTFEMIKLLVEPIPEGYMLPARALLQTSACADILDRPTRGPILSGGTSSHSSDDFRDFDHIVLENSSEDIEPWVRTIVQFVSAANWPATLDFLRNTLYKIRSSAAPTMGAVPTQIILEDERAHLVALRCLAYLWIDQQKLAHVVQELCSHFLHLRKAYQNAIAISGPLMVAGWWGTFPEEFERFHTHHRRLEGGADTLFEMMQSINDPKRRLLFYPFQTILVILMPDVFEVASNLRDARSANLTRKVSFLDTLRKLMRNGNPTAAFCITGILRAARLFDPNSDVGIASYAMDVEDEVRDSVFRRKESHPEASVFDQDMTTVAFVSLAQLNFDIYIDSLMKDCLHPTAPQVFQVALIQACAYFARQPDSQAYRRLFVQAAEFIREKLKNVGKQAVATLMDTHNTPQKNPEATTATTTMICNILRFLNASPMTLFDGSPVDQDNPARPYEETFESFICCLATADDNVRVLATQLAKQLVAEDGIIMKLRQSKRLDSQNFKHQFWSLSATVTIQLSDKYLETEDEATLRSIHGYLESGQLVLTSVPELSEVTELIPLRQVAMDKMETVFLVSLCSPDIDTCQLVTSCIGLFEEECRTWTNRSDAVRSVVPILRNSDVLSEIAARAFRFTGNVAFQKRTRALLRRMQHPSAGILNAWELAFDKWIHLCKDVSTAPADAIDERSFLECRNLSGFLASLGGVCLSDHAYLLDDTSLTSLRWIDRLSTENHEEPLLTRYLRLTIQLLASTTVRVRETMREVLSTELSSHLYPHLFKALETELEVLFTGALETSGRGQDVEIIFAEQAVSLLKSLVDKLETAAELGAASSVHLGSLALSFAKFLNTVTDNVAALRVKIKVCQLTESITKKKEHLNLRDDLRIRNQLLQDIFGWIARPRSPRSDGTYLHSRLDETHRVQRDLDKACLRSLAGLTVRLPLQPSDGQSDANTSELKSQMFHAYFNRFLSLLNYEPLETQRGDLVAGPALRDDSSSVSDLAITILSNLLSANIDVGLKHSLNIGYHENVEIRTAFVKVLYNILVQGTEFNNLSDTAVSEKYDELLELLTNDFSLATAISTACPSNEVDEVTVSLLNIFDSRGLTFELIEALIQQEIEETEHEYEILRRSSVATKMLSVYAKWKGGQYLRDTLQKVIERLLSTAKDLDFEMDPTKVNSHEELQKNSQQLRIVAKVFIDDICASAAHMPSSFKKICNIILSAVQPRFEEAKYTAVGSFIFLRFFCPAIVAPDTEGLVDRPPSKEMRRGLLLIAKVIQNLANNVLFGAKEPYMHALNDFLSQNIFEVTGFLRVISAPPTGQIVEPPPANEETFDFGSCVALHRFLYDHWDHVRQRLMSQERRQYVRSPGELSRGRTPVLEPLRALITNLGPPPMAVTWNRPQINANSPPAYSRFQHFMLRAAFRNSESFLTSRAVYDGGESKDGLSIICVILRHVDQDSIDHDTLLYCLLKIASRMWHKPFGLLIDATCCNTQNEPSDDFFKKVEALVPAELARQLSRIYIYNVNSAFRKCLRRVVRLGSKSETVFYNPANVEYHLIGSLQELQTHFQLSQLHLPKETISVVTDTKYVFQPITRLSKTKGKIEVVIKIGSQFVQVTTNKRQEVHPGFRLNTIVNDIFRLGDVDEAPTSIPTEDDSAFGLRGEGGKIVMYFQSPKKTDVLQAIRSAKAKYGKDTRMLKSFERLIRPQDVPGTLLNLALTNLAAPDAVLRVSSYNLLGSLCRAFKFKAASKFLCLRDVSVPLDPTQFIINISKTLAEEEPHLTSDFLNEFFVGWESFSDEQKPLSLAYMAPWLPGLRTSLLGDESDSEKGKEKIAIIFRKLIDVAATDPTLALTLEYTVWPAIYKDETLLDILLEEIIKAALALGLHDEHTQSLTSIVTAIGTITLRGKIISRLRKALNRSSLRPTKYLPDNTVWSEICVLMQFCLSLSFDCGVQSQLYMPEIFHVVTMLANTGTPDIRVLVHRLLINSIHAACTSFKLDEIKLAKLRSTLDILSEPRNDVFSPPPVMTREGASVSTHHDTAPTLAHTENLASLLFELCSVAAPSVDMGNVWRSRWMSLVASTAFQNNPAIQPRAFTVMGCLAREEVDDDLLYQVLVALRTSVGRFGDDNSSELLIAIVTSLSKMMAKLPSASRYGLQLFWLAMSLLRLVPSHLFNCTAMFLEAVITNIGTSSELRSERMAQFLLQGRSQLEEAAAALDQSYQIHFTKDNFHYAVCAILVRGLTDTVTRTAASRVLSTFLELTTMNPSKSVDRFPRDFYTSPYLALLRARATSPEELKDCLWSAGINPVGVVKLSHRRRLRELEMMDDQEIIVNIAIELVDFEYLEDAAQNHTIAWLNELARERPTVFEPVASIMSSKLDEILLNCQNSATLESAHALLSTMSSNPAFAEAADSTEELREILLDVGLKGLCSTGSYHQSHEQDKECFALTEKLIELITM